LVIKNLIEHVNAIVEKSRLLDYGDKMLIDFLGDYVSLVLLHIPGLPIDEYGISLMVMQANHSLRNEDFIK
jgi:hypothetical protein